MSNHIHDEASKVTAEKGEVQIDGPGGIVLSMTPEAARETGKRLTIEAARAEKQSPSTDIGTLTDIPPGTVSL